MLKCGFFAAILNSCVVNENLHNQVISEDGDTESLTLMKMLQFAKKLVIQILVETIKRVENDLDSEDDGL